MLLPTGISGESPDFAIDNSLRFRKSAPGYLSRTFTSVGDRTTWTWSAWVKRSLFPDTTALWSSNVADDLLYIAFNGTPVFYPGSSAKYVRAAPLLRDPSAWYHLMVVWDTTNATASERVLLYINGVKQTSANGATWPNGYPALNETSGFNNNVAHGIGIGIWNLASKSDGYMTEINFVDGQALTADDFGEIDDDTGVWKPKRYSGSYGTNGFRLDGSGVTDSSGNGNNWTANNMNLSTSSASTYDLMTDVPTLTDENTANYCTLNNIKYVDNSPTYSNANLSYSTGSSWSTTTYVEGTIGVLGGSTGKYYWEVSANYTADYYTAGVALQNNTIGSSNIGTTGSVMVYYGSKYVNGTATSSYITPVPANSVLGIALDASNGKVWFRNSSGWASSGDPAAGTNEAGIISGFSGARLMPVFQSNLNATVQVNFGQRPFSYTPPTGFVQLNTYNLPDSTIKDGSKQFNTVLYSGDGTNDRAITGVGFQPDFTWLKARNDVADHTLFDAVRGAGSAKALYSNSTAVEGAYTAGFDAFLSDGFQVDNNVYTNSSSNTYAAWNWKANGSGVSNTVGSIPSTVSANTTAGFSIVTYTGTGATSSGVTIGHGLGKTPEMIITKCRDTPVVAGGDYWSTWHKDLGGNYGVWLNLTNGRNSSMWGGYSNISSTVFSPPDLNYGNSTSKRYVNYLFTSVEGFSSIGSYTGNGSSDGPFIYTGFRPAWVMVKDTTNANTFWTMYGTARSTYNLTDDALHPNHPAAEYNYQGLDVLANGFKLRAAGADTNASGATIIYAAFAENPFKNSLAR